MPIHDEDGRARRYFNGFDGALFVAAGYGYNSSAGIIGNIAIPTMRTAPSATVTNSSHGGSNTALTLTPLASVVRYSIDPTAGAQTLYHQWNMTLNADL